MKKILSVMMLAAMIIFAGGQNKTSAQELEFVPLTTGEIYSAQVVYGIDFLALRTGPSVYYSEIARIPPGAYIEVVTRSSGIHEGTNFLPVCYRGTWGYAHQRYISLKGHLRSMP